VATSYLLPNPPALLGLSGRATPQLRATGEMPAFDGTCVLLHGPPDAAPSAVKHVIFCRPEFLTSSSSLIPLGTTGLLRQSWGTVLAVEESDGGNIQVEEDDWGNILAVGGTAQKRDVNVTCRILTTTNVPQWGDTFSLRGKSYVVLATQRISKSDAARVISVTGARWEDLSMSVEQVAGGISGWG